MIGHKQNPSNPKLYIRWLGALLFVCGYGMSMPACADEARRIAANHAENWNESLRNGKIDEVMALYSGLRSTVIAPGGLIAGSCSEIEAFWRPYLTVQKVRARLELLSAHFNPYAGGEQKDVIIARYQVHTDETNPSPLSSSALGHLDAILKQETNGQWKTQLQQWF